MDGNKDNIESDSTHVEAALTQKAENQKKLIDDCDETVKGGFVTLGLGDPKYFPSKEEVNDTIQSLCLSLTKFKYYLYLVYIHQMYKFEPYNCKTISEFVSKYLEVSRATVYRAILEISVNIAIYDSYDWKSPKINCNICQKLNRILQTQSVHFLKVFWLNLNKKCGSEITAKKVEQEIYHYIRFNRFSDPTHAYLNNGSNVVNGQDNTWITNFSSAYGADWKFNPFRILAFNRILSDFYRVTDYAQSNPRRFNIDDLESGTQIPDERLRSLFHVMKFGDPDATPNDSYSCFPFAKWNLDRLISVKPSQLYGSFSQPEPTIS